MWGVIITIVIISFVFWGSKSGVNDRGQGQYDLGSINGEKIEKDDYVDAAREVNLGYFLSYGEFPSESSKRMGFDVQRETYFRLFFMAKIKDEKIHVSDETVAKMAADLLHGLNRGQPVSLAQLDQNVLRPNGLTPNDFQRYIRHMLEMQQLISAHVARGKLVTPAEARVLYEREHEQIVTEAVFFSSTNYYSSVASSAEAVSHFWTNQQANYRLPERVQVSYVAFNISNLMAQTETELMKTNFDVQIDAEAQKLGTNYYRDAKTPEEVRARVRHDLIYQEAGKLARKQAYEFVNEVSILTPASAENFEKKAKEKNLTVKTTEPFDENGPTDFVVGADFIKESFSRTAENPYAGPLSGRDAFYAIVLKARLPSEIPPFEKIRDKVTADYQRFEATLFARKAGDEFAQALTNGLASGKKFSSICVEAKVKPVTIPPLSLSDRTQEAVEEHVRLDQYKNAAFTTQVGHASPCVKTADGGFVVFVREKLPLELSKLTAELPDFINRLRQTRQNEAQNEWFNREAQRGLANIPYFRQQQQQQQSGMP
jgi:hypothetical protein